MDICSAIVYSHPKLIQKNIDWLNQQAGVEVHQHDENGKIIISVEDSSSIKDNKTVIQMASETIMQLEKHSDILSIMLISQYSDV